MTDIIRWGWAGRALEVESGDLHVVIRFAGGALVALLDGLGHGPEAAGAASAAVPVLAGFAGEPVVELIQKCHDALHHTRGVVMSVAAFCAADSTLTWTGVGNVEGIVARKKGNPRLSDQALVARGGVVGYRLPPLRASTLTVAPGDTLIMATDGILSGFATGLDLASDPQELAEAILARHASGSDDAHVVVARYLGAGP
jgi:serine phosphatase RsbU (regulator of sigma subunit)